MINKGKFSQIKKINFRLLRSANRLSIFQKNSYLIGDGA